MLTTVLTSIVGALCVAGVFAAIKSRWLYVIAPKLYINTPLSNGQIVSLTFLNAGLLAEEDIVVKFRLGCKFELVGSSKAALTLTGSDIHMSRLSRAESVVVLLLVEGKTFDASDIDSIESKGTHGKVVESKEKATGFLAHLIAWPLVLTILGLPFLFGMTVGGMMGMTPYRYLDDQFSLAGPSMQLAGYKSQIKESNGSIAGQLSNAVVSNKIAISVKSVVRHKDVLTFVIHIKNSTGNIIAGSIDFSGSAGGNGPLDYEETRIGSFSMAAGEEKDFQLKVYLPESQSVQMVQGTYQFKNPDADTLYVSQTVLF